MVIRLLRTRQQQQQFVEIERKKALCFPNYFFAPK